MQTVEVLYEHARTQKIVSYARQAVATLIGGTVAILGATSVATEGGRQNLHALVGSCPAPDDVSLHTVTQLFDGAVASSAPDWPRPSTAGELQTEGHDEKLRLGVTTPQYDRAMLDDLSSALDGASPEEPFSTYLASLADIMGQHGVGVTIGVPGANSAHSGTVPTPEQLESNQAKVSMLEVATFFAGLPVELTKALELKSMRFTVSLVDKSSGSGVKGFAQQDEGLIMLNLLAPELGDTVRHEYYHFVPAAYCPSFQPDDDNTFANLNVQANYAGTWPLPEDFLSRQPQSFEAIEKDYDKARYVARWAAAQGRLDEACSALDQAGRQLGGIEMIRDYSYKEVREDKANIGREILYFDSYGRMLDRHAPVMRAKFLLELARLYELQPGVVEYFAVQVERESRNPAVHCPPGT